ncbi:MAG TPA: hypothetical protein VM870_08020, partial [Pyrinomonadaceae bacterium]|nr:hypothetical protein [Pyrinomonadaceae bacterium]
AANKLQQASAMTITANDPGAVADFNSNRPRRASDEKDQVIFPGTDISFSVEGPYANLRSFVRDVEASKQFITIKSVEFKSGAGERRAPSVVEEPDARPAPVAQNPVTLHLKLGAYFQRGQSLLSPTPEGGASNAAPSGR